MLAWIAYNLICGRWHAWCRKKTAWAEEMYLSYDTVSFKGLLNCNQTVFYSMVIWRAYYSQALIFFSQIRNKFFLNMCGVEVIRCMFNTASNTILNWRKFLCSHIILCRKIGFYKCRQMTVSEFGLWSVGFLSSCFGSHGLMVGNIPPTLPFLGRMG